MRVMFCNFSSLIPLLEIHSIPLFYIHWSPKIHHLNSFSEVRSIKQYIWQIIAVKLPKFKRQFRRNKLTVGQTDDVLYNFNTLVAITHKQIIDRSNSYSRVRSTKHSIYGKLLQKNCISSNANFDQINELLNKRTKCCTTSIYW